MKSHGELPLFSSVFLLAQAWPVVGTWCASVAHHPSSFLLSSSSFFSSFTEEADGIYCWLFSFSKKRLFDILRSETAWGKCDLAQGMDLVGDNISILIYIYIYFHFHKQTVMVQLSFNLDGHGNIVWLRCWNISMFFQFIFLSSHPVLFLRSPMCITHPSLMSWGSLLYPLPWPLPYAKQVSAKRRSTAATSQRSQHGLGGRKKCSPS